MYSLPIILPVLFAASDNVSSVKCPSCKYCRDRRQNVNSATNKKQPPEHAFPAQHINVYQNKLKNKSGEIYNKQDVMPSAYHFSYIYEEKLSPKAMGFFIYFALFVFSVIKLDIIGKTGVKARII